MFGLNLKNLNLRKLFLKIGLHRSVTPVKPQIPEVEILDSFFFFFLLINSVVIKNSLSRQSNMSGLSRQSLSVATVPYSACPRMLSRTRILAALKASVKAC